LAPIPLAGTLKEIKVLAVAARAAIDAVTVERAQAAADRVSLIIMIILHQSIVYLIC
jgi:hypothetical protein